MTDLLGLKIKNHRFEGIPFLDSPNQDELPEQPSLIVIHNISLPPHQFGGNGVVELFTNRLNPTEDPYYEKIKDLKVSAHLFIRRNGDLIQFVPFNRRAWHAGLSCFKGREKCNDYSIGIELEGTDFTPFTHSQYRMLNQVIESLHQAYPSLEKESIVGHSEIAPGRKTDPGPYFLWQALKVAGKA